MSWNPYESPLAPVDNPIPQVPVPVHLSRKIRDAWIVSSGLALLVCCHHLYMAASPAGFDGDWWFLIDVILNLGFGVGFFLRVRAAAVMALIVHAGTRVPALIRDPNVHAIGTCVFLLWVFADATRAVFAYHRLRQESQNEGC